MTLIVFSVLGLLMYLSLRWQLQVAVLAVTLAGPVWRFHRRGLARLERAGLRRGVDVDGYPIEGESPRDVAGGNVRSAVCRIPPPSS